MFVLIKGKKQALKIGITFQLIADNKKKQTKVQLGLSIALSKVFER